MLRNKLQQLLLSIGSGMTYRCRSLFSTHRHTHIHIREQCCS